MSTGNQIFQTKHIVNLLGETYKIFSSAYNIRNECIYNLEKKSVQKICTKIKCMKEVNKCKYHYIIFIYHEGGFSGSSVYRNLNIFLKALFFIRLIIFISKI